MKNKLKMITMTMKSIVRRKVERALITSNNMAATETVVYMCSIVISKKKMRKEFKMMQN
jgi:hypothetical protein